MSDIIKIISQKLKLRNDHISNILNNIKKNYDICKNGNGRWFLVETDQVRTINGRGRMYCSIHESELKDEFKEPYSYNGKSIKFQRIGLLIRCRPLLVSKDFTFIERARLQLENCFKLPQYPAEPNRKYFLLLFQSQTAIGFQIVAEHFAPYEKVYLDNGRQALVVDNKIVHLLLQHTCYDYLVKVLQQMQHVSYNFKFDHLPDDVDQLKPDSKMLVQFNLGCDVVYYQIKSYKDTAWRNENMHKDKIAYIPIGNDIVCQSFVLGYSNDESRIIELMLFIKNLGMDLKFSSRKNIIKRLKQYNSIFTEKHIPIPSPMKATFNALIQQYIEKVHQAAEEITKDTLILRNEFGSLLKLIQDDLSPDQLDILCKHIESLPDI